MTGYLSIALPILAAALAAALASCQPATPPATETPEIIIPATEIPPTEVPDMEEPSGQEGLIELPAFQLAMNFSDLVTLDPAWAGEPTSKMVLINTYDTLVDIRPEDLTTKVPRLAESWEISSDNMVYTFKLKPDIQFASGNPVTAEDVRFSWMRLINIKGAPSFNLELVDTIDVVDDLTVQVNMKEPNPSFLASAANPTLGILDSRVVKDHGGTDALDADRTDTAREWLDQNSAGSGSYVLTSWLPGSELTFDPNIVYWKGTPQIGKIVIHHVEDPASKLQMLEMGEADLIDRLDYDLVEQASANPDLVIDAGQSLDQAYLA